MNQNNLKSAGALFLGFEMRLFDNQKTGLRSTELTLLHDSPDGQNYNKVPGNGGL